VSVWHMLARLIWPVPALLAWASAWGLFLLLPGAGVAPIVALLAACLWGAAFSLLGATVWRRAMIGLGFPLSLALSGMAAVPAWGWLIPLGVLLLIYPVKAWRDAPVFPTPRHALRDLARHAPLDGGALVLDAGCGLGDGLQALRLGYPTAALHGVEWSWPLRAVCALRCPWARVRQGDIWHTDWSPYAMVYLFQRPESMARAVAKAQAQMRPGTWLVSLEFEANTMKPETRLDAPDGRPVWLYRMPEKPVNHPSF
jgi:hypothetical protein